MTEERTDHFPDEGMVDFDTEVEGDAGGQPPTAPAPAPETDPVAAATAKVAELTADLQRLQAEYLNYKRRVDRDRDLVLQNAKFTVLSALLPVLDDVDRAREHGELHGGFKAVAESLQRVVAGEGLVRFGAPGDEFDPRLHEALMHSHSSEVATTTCERVVQAGYQIGDRVVRPALVTVVDPEPPGATAPPESPEPSRSAEAGETTGAAGDGGSAEAAGADQAEAQQ